MCDSIVMVSNWLWNCLMRWYFTCDLFWCNTCAMWYAFPTRCPFPLMTIWQTSNLYMPMFVVHVAWHGRLVMALTIIIIIIRIDGAICVMAAGFLSYVWWQFTIATLPFCFPPTPAMYYSSLSLTLQLVCHFPCNVANTSKSLFCSVCALEEDNCIAVETFICNCWVWLVKFGDGCS